MEEKIILDMLTQTSVSICKQRFVVVDGNEYPVGDPWRRAYVNSSQEREQVQHEVSEPYRSVILLMWGDTPLITTTD